MHNQVSNLALANTIITLNYQESLQSLLTSAVHLGDQKYGPSAPNSVWSWVWRESQVHFCLCKSS